MTAQHEITQPEPADALASEERRNFLRGLSKWSLAVIGGVLLGGALTASNQANAAVAVGARGGWANRYGGGAGWANRYGGGGAAWANRYGGGGAGWVNRYGGGWINRY
jgi:hypothetical protein